MFLVWIAPRFWCELVNPRFLVWIAPRFWCELVNPRFLPNWKVTRAAVLSGEGGTEAQKAAVQRQEEQLANFRGTTPRRQDGYCSYCSVANNLLMACESKDVPPHPSRPNDTSRAEDMKRSRLFNWLLDMERAESILGRQSAPV